MKFLAYNITKQSRYEVFTDDDQYIGYINYIDGKFIFFSSKKPIELSFDDIIQISRYLK